MKGREKEREKKEKREVHTNHKTESVIKHKSQRHVSKKRERKGNRSYIRIYGRTALYRLGNRPKLGIVEKWLRFCPTYVLAKGSKDGGEDKKDAQNQSPLLSTSFHRLSRL